MKIIYMGTPEFAVPSLQMLIDEGYDILAVVTQPDRPKGRGNKMSAPPVKEFALEKGIKVLQPEKVKTSEFVCQIKELSPDLLITCAYGKILPKDVLDIPQFGCINVHGSLLPKYRGSAPIHWAIINGETKTGITTMYTDIGMDTGDMLLKEEVLISEDTTTGDLHDQLSILGAKILKDTLEALKKVELKRIPQQEEEATNAPMMKKEVGAIDWTKSSQEIHNLVRGTNPWPGAYTFYNGCRMRVWRTVVDHEADKCNEIKRPGTILDVSTDGFKVVCGKGLIRILEVQVDCGRKMCIDEYICGHTISKGELLE